MTILLYYNTIILIHIHVNLLLLLAYESKNKTAKDLFEINLHTNNDLNNNNLHTKQKAKTFHKQKLENSNTLITSISPILSPNKNEIDILESILIPLNKNYNTNTINKNLNSSNDLASSRSNINNNSINDISFNNKIIEETNNKLNKRKYNNYYNINTNTNMSMNPNNNAFRQKAFNKNNTCFNFNRQSTFGNNNNTNNQYLNSATTHIFGNNKSGNSSSLNNSNFNNANFKKGRSLFFNNHKNGIHNSAYKIYDKTKIELISNDLIIKKNEMLKNLLSKTFIDYYNKLYIYLQCLFIILSYLHIINNCYSAYPKSSEYDKKNMKYNNENSNNNNHHQKDSVDDTMVYYNKINQNYNEATSVSKSIDDKEIKESRYHNDSEAEETAHQYKKLIADTNMDYKSNIASDLTGIKDTRENQNRNKNSKMTHNLSNQTHTQTTTSQGIIEFISYLQNETDELIRKNDSIKSKQTKVIN